MKTIKMFSLDVELMEKLADEPNASALVNRLIHEHYGKQPIKKMPLAEKKRLLELVRKRDALLKEIDLTVEKYDDNKGE